MPEKSDGDDLKDRLVEMWANLHRGYLLKHTHSHVVKGNDCLISVTRSSNKCHSNETLLGLTLQIYLQEVLYYRMLHAAHFIAYSIKIVIWSLWQYCGTNILQRTNCSLNGRNSLAKKGMDIIDCINQISYVQFCKLQQTTQ